jgi:hypothetical protein
VRRSALLFALALPLIALSTTWAAGGSTGVTLNFANVRVSNDSYPAHSEPDIAENPANPNNLVAGSKFFTDPARYEFVIGTYYSMDGGRSWHDDGPLPGFSGFGRTSDISFAYGPTGKTVYACVLGENEASSGAVTRSGIYVSRSHDGGKTWSRPVTVFEDPTGATFSDKPWIAVDSTTGPNRGTVYVAWNLDDLSAGAGDPDSGQSTAPVRSRQADATVQTGFVVASSTDFGKTFSVPVTVRPFGPQNSNFALGGIPQVSPNGHLYVAYVTYDDVDVNGKTTQVNRLAVADSGDEGTTFTIHVAVKQIAPLPDVLPNGTFRNFSLPTFAVSPATGTLVLAWADYRNHRADVFAARSTDGGRTWSAPARINHDSVQNSVDHFQPALAVSPNGTFSCAWFDRRYSPGNRLIDEVIAQSGNDGKTFGANIRVTSHSWDPSVGAPHVALGSKVTFIGDYQGLAVDNTHLHPLWNDTQNGKSQEIRTAVIAESVFTTRR